MPRGFGPINLPTTCMAGCVCLCTNLAYLLITLTRAQGIMQVHTLNVDVLNSRFHRGLISCGKTLHGVCMCVYAPLRQFAYLLITLGHKNHTLSVYVLNSRFHISK